MLAHILAAFNHVLLLPFHTLIFSYSINTNKFGTLDCEYCFLYLLPTYSCLNTLFPLDTIASSTFFSFIKQSKCLFQILSTSSLLSTRSSSSLSLHSHISMLLSPFFLNFFSKQIVHIRLITQLLTIFI